MSSYFILRKTGVFSNIFSHFSAKVQSKELQSINKNLTQKFKGREGVLLILFLLNIVVPDIDIFISVCCHSCSNILMF